LLEPDFVKLDLLESFDYISAHRKLGEVVTDSSGRFAGDAGSGANVGEEHNLQKEIHENQIDDLSQDIAKIVQNHNPPRLFLALPEPISKRVKERLKSLSAKYPLLENVLYRCLEDDIVKMERIKLIEFFNSKAKEC